MKGIVMKNKKAVKSLVFLMSVLMLCAALAGCGAKEATFDSQDGKYQVTADTSWSDSAGELADGEAMLEISNERQEKYLLFMAFDKANYGAMFADLAAYNADMTDGMINAYTDSKVIGSKELQMDNYKAIVTEVEFAYEGHDITSWFFSIETEDDYLTAMGWTLKSNADKYGDQIEKIVSSLKAK